MTPRDVLYSEVSISSSEAIFTDDKSGLKNLCNLVQLPSSAYMALELEVEIQSFLVQVSSFKSMASDDTGRNVRIQYIISAEIPWNPCK